VKLTDAAEPQAGSDAASVAWITNWHNVALAFDHAEIVADAEAWLGA
jgi:hypothetical protein